MGARRSADQRLQTHYSCLWADYLLFNRKDSLPRYRYRLAGESGALLVCGWLGLTLTTVNAVRKTDNYSLRMAFEGATACPSGEPTGPGYFTYAFEPGRRGPGSIAPRVANTGLFRPHFMLEDTVGSEEHFTLEVHQSSHLRDLCNVLPTAGDLRTPHAEESLDNVWGGAHDPPPP